MHNADVGISEYGLTRTGRFDIRPGDCVAVPGLLSPGSRHGATGHVVEYAGSVIRDMGMSGRMTVCNMSIEGGARAGMIAPDDTTFSWLEGRDFVTPEDIQVMAYDVLRHRVLLTYEAEAEGVVVEDFIHELINEVPVP